MRKRFIKGGFDNYSPHEVIEQLLFNVLPRVNTNETAHSLLCNGRSIMDVLRMSREELMRIRGIGEKSADYIRSLIPRVSDMILRQYRELPELNIYNIAFLGDWFLTPEHSSKIGAIIFDAERRFADFVLLDAVLEDGELDPYGLGDVISKRLSAERYCLIARQENEYVIRENMLTLRDYTSRLGSYMTDAYALCRTRPVSYLYVQERKAFTNLRR